MIGLAFMVLAAMLTSLGIAFLLMLFGQLTPWEDQFWYIAIGFITVAVLGAMFLAILTGLEATHVIGR